MTFEIWTIFLITTAGTKMPTIGMKDTSQTHLRLVRLLLQISASPGATG